MASRRGSRDLAEEVSEENQSGNQKSVWDKLADTLNRPRECENTLPTLLSNSKLF